mmetsp:Transcript_36896/g.56486  ORF Transcript_36896/g.56486 Transcript_36896/m.56486 type:complete len:372 (-) Transcript_36896:3-1118(-)
MGLRLSLVDLVHEEFHSGGEVLFIHHIEGDADFRVLLGLKVSIELRLDVVLTQDLEATGNNLHLEERVPHLHLLRDAVEDVNFLLQRNGTVIVDHHTEDVLPLNDHNILLHQGFADELEQSLEAVVEVVEFISEHELGLEVLPNLVMLLGLDSSLQEDGVLQVLIELSGRLPELAEVVHLNVAFGDLLRLLSDLEHFILLAEIDDIKIAQSFHQEFHVRGGRQMDVVEHGLGHHVQQTVQRGLLKNLRLLIVGSGDNGVILLEKTLSNSVELLRGDLLLGSELDSVGEMGLLSKFDKVLSGLQEVLVLISLSALEFLLELGKVCAVGGLAIEVQLVVELLLFLGEFLSTGTEDGSLKTILSSGHFLWFFED